MSSAAEKKAKLLADREARKEAERLREEAEAQELLELERREEEEQREREEAERREREEAEQREREAGERLAIERQMWAEDEPELRKMSAVERRRLMWQPRMGGQNETEAGDSRDGGDGACWHCRIREMVCERVG